MVRGVWKFLQLYFFVCENAIFHFYLDRNLGFCSYVSSTLLKDIFIKKLFLNLLHAKFSRKIYLINISCTLFYLTILPTFMALFSELPQLNITAKMTLQSAEYSKSLQTFWIFYKWVSHFGGNIRLKLQSFIIYLRLTLVKLCFLKVFC